MLALVLAACGGSDGDDLAAVATPTPAAQPTATEVPLDLPEGAGDLAQVCSTGTGFADLPAYDPAQPGPHPIHVELENQGGSFSSPNVAPREWGVNSDNIESAMLVACGRIVQLTPNGEVCDFNLVDGSVLTLPLVDVTYEVEVLSASDATVQGSFTLEAPYRDCLSPGTIASTLEPDATEYFNTRGFRIDEAAVADALSTYVNP